MKNSQPLTGEEVINFIIKNDLVHVAGQKAAVFVWSKNAPSQIDAFLKSRKKPK